MTTGSVKAVYQLLRERNAPLNVQLLVDNLQTQKIKKSQVEKSLDKLVSDGKVTKKEFGKSKLFYLAQATLEKACPEELAALKAKVSEIKSEINNEKQQVTGIKKEVSQLKTQLTDAQLEERIKSLEKEVAEKEKKCAGLNSGKGGTVSKASFTETKLHLQQNLVLWKKYKRMFTGIWDTVLESMETVKESKLRDDACIETDESAGVKYSALDDIVKKRKLGV
jgi:Fe2+ or Zn2+ uptake regulation protein